MEFFRDIDIAEKIKRKSIFLLGPRQTGKTSYLEKTFKSAMFINLLRPNFYRDLLKKPELLENMIKAFDFSLSLKETQVKLVIIDEVQKIPELLDVVHLMIEADKSLRFILTGSSARKLKRKGANLLGGRALQKYFFPINYKEQFVEKIDLEKILLDGSLPSILNSDDPFEDLDSYVTTYLKEEINQEGAVRSLAGFSRFLNFAALRNGEQLNYSNLANDAQVSPVTVKEYYHVLEDTLIGTLVPVFAYRPKRKVAMNDKFYFFDTGVCNAILKRRSIVNGSIEWGQLLETYIVNEIRSYLSYNSKEYRIYFWRTNSKIEVDFILAKENSEDEIVAIEIKSTEHPIEKHSSGLRAFKEEYQSAKCVLVCQCHTALVFSDGTEVLPIFTFLEKLHNGKIL